MDSAGRLRAARLSTLGEKPGHSSGRGSERKRSKKRGLSNPERQSSVKTTYLSPSGKPGSVPGENSHYFCWEIAWDRYTKVI